MKNILVNDVRLLWKEAGEYISSGSPYTTPQLQFIQKSVPPPIFCRKLVKFGEIYLSVYCLDYLTYPHLGPVAGAVVPLDAVVVPGVQDGQAGLHSDARPLEEIFSIVRLSNLVGHEL